MLIRGEAFIRGSPLFQCEYPEEIRGNTVYSHSFVNTFISNSPKFQGTNFLGSDGLLCFSSTFKFGSFKIPFATILSQFELYFRLR